MRKLLLVAAAGLALTGCTTKLAASSPPSTDTSTSTVTSTVTSTSAAGTTTKQPTSSKSTTSTTTTSAARFSNTQPYAELVGYDEAGHLLEFRVLTRHQRDGMQDEFDHVPADQATHRLRLADSVNIDGIQGGDSSICPNATDGKCTTAQLLGAVDGDAQLVVQLVVSEDDRITEVAEQIGMLL